MIRALGKNPLVAEALLAELDPAKGMDADFDAHVVTLKNLLLLLPANPADIEFRARELMQKIALAVQGSLLLRHAPTAVAQMFCASRFGKDESWGAAYGVLPAPTGGQVKSILARAWPACGLAA